MFYQPSTLPCTSHCLALLQNGVDSKPRQLVYILQSFCDSGTLYDAIEQGRLRGNDGQPALQPILITGLLLLPLLPLSVGRPAQPRAPYSLFTSFPNLPRTAFSWTVVLIICFILRLPASCAILGRPAGLSLDKQHLSTAATCCVCPHLCLRTFAALEIAGALRYLHAYGVCHGDLNPSNVLLKSSTRDPRRWIPQVVAGGGVAPTC